MTACSYLFLRLLWYEWQCFRTNVVPCWRRELQHQSSPRHELHAKHCVGTIIKLVVAALKILQSPNIRVVLEVLTQLGPLPYGVVCLYSGKMWKLSILLRVTRQNLHLSLGGATAAFSPSIWIFLTQYGNDICKVNLMVFTLNTVWFREWLFRRLCKYILGCSGFQGDDFVLRNVYGNWFSLGWSLRRFWISASSSKTTLLPWNSS